MRKIGIKKDVLKSRKFARYRIWFGISFGAYLAAWILEMALLGAGIRATPPADASFRQAFTVLATGEGVLYLVTLLAAVTVYAPAVSLLAPVVRGFVTGYVLSSLLPMDSGKAVLAFFLAALYFSLSSAWYLAYASFCTCVSLRIFSAHTEKCAAGEERLFGGTLFYSEIFCGTVNLRFLFSFLLFFCASLAVQLLLVALFALGRTHFF